MPHCMIGLMAGAMACWSPVSSCGSVDQRDILVVVKVSGDVVTVDVNLHVAASPEEVWDVLTDFDQMAQIVTNLQASRIVSRSANIAIVAQEGRASFGLLSFSFDTLREVELKPFAEIRARLIGGSMHKMEGTTRLIAEAVGTRIVSHGEFIPNVWVPPVVRPTFIEAETRKQFGEMREEIIRRKRRG